MKKKLSNLIKDPNLERLILELKKPNIFSILKVENREIRHSNFLSWLLDPKESHNLGPLFLKWFLRDIFSNSKIDWATEFDVDTLSLDKVSVKREWHHIDILIITQSFVISIENKILTKEHSNQLNKYRKLIQSNFPDKKQAFVYLSPTGLIPDNKDDSDLYVVYSYSEVRKNIEILLEVYSESLSDKIRTFLQDYLIVIRRSIMKDHDSIDLAREIYFNHKDAIDFIIENKPDRLLEIGTIIQKAIKKLGYISASSSKGYIRFLTKKLNKVIPRTGKEWKNKEAFAFELNITDKNISFKTIIAPGNETNRQLLSNSISNVNGSKKPSGEIWLAHFIKNKRFDLANEKHEDDKVYKVIFKFIKDQKSLIDSVEKEIDKVSKNFINTN